jgi:hypothetical protein
MGGKFIVGILPKARKNWTNDLFCKTSCNLPKSHLREENVCAKSKGRRYDYDLDIETPFILSEGRIQSSR